MVGEMLISRSLAVVSSLLVRHSPGDGAARLRRELAASETGAVGTLMAVLERPDDADGEGNQQLLREQALEILTELAFDDSFERRDAIKLVQALVRIFLEEEEEEEAGNASTAVDVAESGILEAVEQADRHRKATILRRKAGEALARLLPVHYAGEHVSVADKLFKQEAIDLFTKVLVHMISSEMAKTADAVRRFVIQKKNRVIEVLDQILSNKMGNYSDVAIRAAREAKQLVIEEHEEILSSKMGTKADAAKRALTKIQNLSPEALGTILPSKMETTVFVVSLLRLVIKGIEKQSEEIKLMEATLSLAVVICNENFISREDLADAIPEDAAVVKKLMEILKVNNKQSTAECLRIVKLTCQVVIAMIEVKPSCIQHFNEYNFKEALTESLESMSEVYDCMLFAGNDREVIKPATSLASLVREALELLETA